MWLLKNNKIIKTPNKNPCKTSFQKQYIPQQYWTQLVDDVTSASPTQHIKNCNYTNNYKYNNSNGLFQSLPYVALSVPVSQSPVRATNPPG